MIKIEYCPERFHIKARGHAGYGTHGNDIICSAVSTLIETLAFCIIGYSMALEREPTIMIDEESALIEISAVPKKEYERDISLLFWFCLCGLDALCEQFPKNVGITVLRQEDELHTDSRP
ncbi:MAG: ribosomal-processing cysteine protease Prp [Ruminococcaceae bacterium]|nr:ribosomal-processing cysteine protease Prp [Oscillospiraceae bacterium]